MRGWEAGKFSTENTNRNNNNNISSPPPVTYIFYVPYRNVQTPPPPPPRRRRSIIRNQTVKTVYTCENNKHVVVINITARTIKSSCSLIEECVYTNSTNIIIIQHHRYIVYYNIPFVSHGLLACSSPSSALHR